MAKKRKRKPAKPRRYRVGPDMFQTKRVLKSYGPKRTNPGTTIRGWVKARAVKIVRNKRGQAVSVKIKT